MNSKRSDIDNRKKPPLIIIAGPTAVGKSAAAVSLCRRLSGEVVSADSMQVYRGMDIGTAKIKPEEQQGVPHHLIDVIEPTEDYNVVRFQQMAGAACGDILRRGKVPVLCGGTGFYIQALLYGIDFTEEAPNALSIRKALLTEAEEKGADGARWLHERLRGIDPEAAEAIPMENQKRVIRALEFFELHHKKISEHNREQAERRQNAAYDYRFYVLTDERARLYERIDRRVDRMFEEGLSDEVSALLKRGVRRESTAMQGIGYREVCAALSGACSMEEARLRIKQNSRHYAKRQLTWFRREKEAVWVDIGTVPDTADFLCGDAARFLSGRA